jgi:mRNA-degrading endonuclease toxin of MazEF toxin-antitoxin module
MVSRGQVWAYVQGSRQYRVLIISNDEFNVASGVGPWALRVDRECVGAADVGLVVRMGAHDPLPGACVHIPAVIRIDRTALRESLGLVSHATMEAVEEELRDFLGLP